MSNDRMRIEYKKYRELTFLDLNYMVMVAIYSSPCFQTLHQPSVNFVMSSSTLVK